MQLLVHTIFLIHITQPHSPTLPPTPNNHSNTFWICNLLNEYGCNAASIPTVVLAFIKQYASSDYYIPTDRCDYHTVNLTTIQSEENVDLSLLSVVPSDIFTQTPCEFLVQLPYDLLHQKNVTYLTDYDYWFTDGNYLNCNQSLIINCDYNISNQTSNKNTNKLCYLGTECLYPFVQSTYVKYYPRQGGMCHCNIDCRLRPFKWKISTFDTIIDICACVSSISLLIYFINTGSECYFKRKYSKQSNLAGDLPPVIACIMVIFVICFVVPKYDRQSFTCEDRIEWNTSNNMPKGAVYSGTLPQANTLCYVSGITIYICLIFLFGYFALLSFVIYRSISAPMNSLWNIKKRYWHLMIFVYTVVFTSIAIYEGAISADLTFGTCGPSFWNDITFFTIAIPGCLTIIIFIICTPLNIYYICKHIKYGRNIATGAADKGLINLYIRLIIYSIFIVLSATGFLYVSFSMYLHNDAFNEIIAEYVECLVVNFQLQFNADEQMEIIQNGDILDRLENVCILDPKNKFPAMNLMGIIIICAVLSVGFGTMIFSCSLSKLKQWNNIVCFVCNEIKDKRRKTIETTTHTHYIPLVETSSKAHIKMRQTESTIQ
eukprot:438001_1